MTRTCRRSPSSRAPWAAAIGFSIAVVGALTSFTSNGSGWARAAIIPCYYDVDKVSSFPIAGSSYSSINGTGFGGGSVPIEILSLGLTSPADTMATTPLPAPGAMTTIDSFFDVFVELNHGPGSDPFVIDSFFDITYRIAGGGGSSGGGFAPEGTWPIELLSMNLTGNHPGVGPILIRESPTLASLGEHSLHPMPGTPSMPDGMLAIDSFFDVFTELSLDAGQTWTPADAPLRMTITRLPEPGTVALALLGAAGCAMIARRRRS